MEQRVLDKVKEHGAETASQMYVADSFLGDKNALRAYASAILNLWTEEDSSGFFPEGSDDPDLRAFEEIPGPKETAAAFDQLFEAFVAGFVERRFVAAAAKPTHFWLVVWTDDYAEEPAITGCDSPDEARKIKDFLDARKTDGVRVLAGPALFSMASDYKTYASFVSDSFPEER